MAQDELKPPMIPEVLVLLAAYNGASWISVQIKSILAQEGVAIKIVVRDDRSSDDTAEIITKEFFGDERVKLIVAEQPSGSAGANFRELIRSVNCSGFDFVAFADQDDVWLSHKIQAAVDGLLQNGAQGYSGTVEAFWPDGRTRILRQDSQLREADFLFEGAGQGCTFVLAANLFDVVQRFINGNFEACSKFHYHDWLVYLIARSVGKKWFFDPQVVMCYRQHDGNEIGARGGLSAIARRLGMIRDGWYRRQLTLASNLYLETSRSSANATRLADMLARAPGTRSIAARLKLAWWTLKWGRRRFSDRLVVSLACLAGWI